MNDINDLCNSLTQLQDGLEMGLIRPDLSSAARFLYCKEAVLIKRGMLQSTHVEEATARAQTFVQRFIPGQVSQ